MKKSILGLAAIALAVLFSSFIATHKVHRTTSYKWFRISGNVMPASAVPSANATYINDGDAPLEDSGCDGSTYQCVSGFNANQVNGSNQLNGNNQAPQVLDSEKD